MKRYAKVDEKLPAGWLALAMALGALIGLGIRMLVNQESRPATGQTPLVGDDPPNLVLEAPKLPLQTSSPSWQTSTRLVAGVLMVVLVAALALRLQIILAPLALSLLLAFLLYPLTRLLTFGGRFPRWAGVTIVYLVIVLLLAGATTGAGFAITDPLGELVSTLNSLTSDLPARIEQLTQQEYSIGPWSIDLSTMDLDPILQPLTSSITPLLSRTGNMLASLAGATASALSLILLVLVFSFYLLLDYEKLGDRLLMLVPSAYQHDFRRLGEETGKVWQAFLRGQLLLGLATGLITWIILVILGLRFALGLGLVAGFMEFIPIFGPFIAGAVAVIVALFQTSNDFGLSPLGYAIVIAAAFLLIQQLENNVLVPRIIGHSLNLSPLVVLLAALAGGSLAGILGVLLAAPTVASLRLWLGYVYVKTVGLDRGVGTVLAPLPAGDERPLWRRALQRPRRWRRWPFSRETGMQRTRTTRSEPNLDETET